jgi:hypothetical protein
MEPSQAKKMIFMKNPSMLFFIGIFATKVKLFLVY